MIMPEPLTANCGSKWVRGLCLQRNVFTYFEHISADYLQEMVMDALESSNILIDRLANLSTEGPNIDTKSASKAKSKT